MGVGAEMKQEGHGSYSPEETNDWQAAGSWPLGNKGSSGNMKTQWKPEEGSLSNENVKCLKPSG